MANYTTPENAQRNIAMARHIHLTGDTIRQTARIFNVSKTAVHVAMTRWLPAHHPHLAAQVLQVLATNKADRHLRGGAATKRRWDDIYKVAHSYNLTPADQELVDKAVEVLTNAK